MRQQLNGDRVPPEIQVVADIEAPTPGSRGLRLRHLAKLSRRIVFGMSVRPDAGFSTEREHRENHECCDADYALHSSIVQR
jgi:hypothetical protein